jgi:hypothetical protein
MSNNGAYTASGSNASNGDGPPGSNAVTIRAAHPTDNEALRRLAERDSARPIDEPAVVAQVDGELRAAVSVRTGDTVADPFHPTAELVNLLRLHTRLV